LICLPSTDTGGTPTSYPVPTWSACKGIFEAIAFLSSGDAWSCPTKVEVCKRCGAKGGSVRFQKYTTNYGGPLRKTQVISKGANMQLFATALSDVCYRIYGEVRSGSKRRSRKFGQMDRWSFCLMAGTLCPSDQERP